MYYCCVSVGRLEGVSWRVDYTLSSSELQEVNEPTVQLCLQTQGAETGSTETTIVSVSADKFRVLLTGELVMYHKYCCYNKKNLLKYGTRILRASLISISLYASPPPRTKTSTGHNECTTMKQDSKGIE